MPINTKDNLSFITENNGVTVTEQEFSKTVLGHNNQKIIEESKTIIQTMDEFIMDRLGQNMEITIGVVQSYDKKTRKARVEFVTDINYNTQINERNNNYSINRILNSTKQTFDIFNFSIFPDLNPGTPVVIVSPQGGYKSNYFIIGVLGAADKFSLHEICDALLEANKKRIQEITILQDLIKRLEEQNISLANRISVLENKVNDSTQT